LGPFGPGCAEKPLMIAETSLMMKHREAQFESGTKEHVPMSEIRQDQIAYVSDFLATMSVHQRFRLN
jgi:hypothetical protein